jgi:hypothetical protein
MTHRPAYLIYMEARNDACDHTNEARHMSGFSFLGVESLRKSKNELTTECAPQTGASSADPALRPTLSAKFP